MTQETYQFQAEINQLLSLIINTFYSNKDVFLRELISNSSDAIDKAKHIALSSDENEKKTMDFNIEITADKENKTLTIRDNGVGMTKDDMIACLGTIANSGTKQFMEALQSGADLSLIGQFGVGFYSAYLVADNVQVYSKHGDSSKMYCWESKAGGSFTITELEESKFDVGTEIVLTMKEDSISYLEQSKLEEIVTTHSEYITYPIMLWTTRSESKEVPDEEETETEQSDDKEKANSDNEEGKIETIEEDNESGEAKPKKTKTVVEEISEWKHLNTKKPLWQRKPDDVTEEEYGAFYKSLTNDWDTHMMVKHFAAEGQIEYKSLLYVPKRAPFDMFKNTVKKNNIKLYVKRVFIMDKFEDMLPEWLGFVSGVVDSDDLPLNVSREMLQQNNVLKVIQRNLIKKCVEMITELAEEEDQTKYNSFYEQFHQSIKLGIHEDSKNRDKLIKLLRFESGNHEDKISLDKYVSEMKEDQKEIYYIAGESRKAVCKSPFVKGVLAKGYDVLFMTSAIDEYMVQQVREFSDKKLVNVTKHHADFTKSDEEYEKYLCARMKEVLDNVDKVVVSTRLGEDPCCIVTSEYGWTANMERIMKAQTLSTNANHGMMMGGTKKTMEINPSNPMVMKLQDGVKNSTMNDTVIKDAIKLMYDTAIISCGYSHEDPTSFTSRIYKMIALGIDVDVSTEDNGEQKVDSEFNTTENESIEKKDIETGESTMEEVD
jgi:molecular chaperone HtpG